MTAKIIDGVAIATQIRERIANEVAALVGKGYRRPGLAVIMLGEDFASQKYVANKTKACDEIGFLSRNIQLSDATTQAQLIDAISELNNAPEIDGILVQMPLPEHINANAVLEHIQADKDVDGFHPFNMGRLALRRPLLESCTPKGIVSLLKSTQVNLQGLYAVVVGASNIVGRPMTLELLRQGCTVTTTHRFTQNLASHIRSADIVIAAAGKPNLIQGEWIKPGAIVIDVGINRDADNHLTGDVDFEQAVKRAGWITPVPGGVGPMTVAALMENTLFAAKQLHLKIATEN